MVDQLADFLVELKEFLLVDMLAMMMEQLMIVKFADNSAFLSQLEPTMLKNLNNKKNDLINEYRFKITNVNKIYLL